MRIIAALLILAIICQGTLAVTSKARQSKLLIEKANASLSRSHFGRALKGMIQIASKLGYEYSDLYAAFSALQNNLLDKLDTENNLFEEQTAYHWDVVRQLEADISQYTTEIQETSEALDSATAELGNYRVLLAQAEESLASHKTAKKDAEDALSYATEVFQTEQVEYAEVREVIGEAIAKLNEAQSHYDNAQLAGFSFVQLKNTFVSFAQKVKSTTDKLPAKHQLFVKPVIQAMLAVKQDAGSSSIQLAINALQSLQGYFDQALSDLTNIFVAYKASLEQTIESETSAIAVLENDIIPGYQSNIQVLEVTVDSLTNQLAVARENLASAEESLRVENENWAAVEARHQALVDRINSEYSLVGEAERIIRTAQYNQLQPRGPPKTPS